MECSLGNRGVLSLQDFHANSDCPMSDVLFGHSLDIFGLSIHTVLYVGVCMCVCVFTSLLASGISSLQHQDLLAACLVCVLA